MSQKRSPEAKLGKALDTAVGTRPDATPNASVFKQIMDLNSAFLDLLVDLRRSLPPERSSILGLDRQHVDAIGLLSSGARTRIARCRYYLFTLDLIPDSPRHPGPGVEEPHTAEAGPPADLHRFARSALTGGWMLARTHPLWARTLLNLTADQCCALGSLSPLDLEYLKQDAHLMVMARLANNPSFWPDLIELAGSGTRDQFEAAKLAGMQQPP